jgi:two-component system, LuxR family, sensor kinase FixL
MSAAQNGEVRAPAPRPDLLDDREAFEFALDAHLLTDTHGVVLDANSAASHLFQTPRDFLVGKPLGLLIAYPDRPAFYACLTRLPAPGAADTLELRIDRRGVGPRDVVAVAVGLGDAGGRSVVYRWLFRDVTGPRRAERELQRERQLLEGVVDAADAVILVVDGAGRILRTNAYLHDVSGYAAEELKGRDWCYMLLAKADRGAGRRVVAQALAHGTGRTGPLGFEPAGRSGRAVVWSARGQGGSAEPAVVLVGHDVTDLQEAQAQVVRAERLAAVGEMAAGLAHESRNALQRGQACLSMLGLRLADRPDLTDLLLRAQKAQDDLHRLYEGVLNYAAPVRIQAAPCDLTPVWREAWADLAETEKWGEAELIEDGDGPAPRCLADGFHMRRVFRNLFENARSAVTGPMRVTIGWSAATLNDRPGLQIGVRDNGPGFPPTARGRLFEAFFTTKTRGTGLGLALCKRVVDEHGGRIEAGRDGPGAEVIITLPRSNP